MKNGSGSEAANEESGEDGVLRLGRRHWGGDDAREWGTICRTRIREIRWGGVGADEVWMRYETKKRQPGGAGGGSGRRGERASGGVMRRGTWRA